MLVGEVTEACGCALGHPPCTVACGGRILPWDAGLRLGGVSVLMLLLPWAALLEALPCFFRTMWLCRNQLLAALAMRPAVGKRLSLLRGLELDSLATA